MRDPGLGPLILELMTWHLGKSTTTKAPTETSTDPLPSSHTLLNLFNCLFSKNVRRSWACAQILLVKLLQQWTVDSDSLRCAVFLTILPYLFPEDDTNKFDQDSNGIVVHMSGSLSALVFANGSLDSDLESEGR
jgi:hypothetical protein